jgi:4-amino-4-deoxy-L-arabinose transferase-like glycosyltransferase
LLWAGWLACYGVVFSIASGIFHPYYLIMLAPAAAALAGIGAGSLWETYRTGGWAAWVLPVALMATALWENLVMSGYPQWSAWLTPLLFGVSTIAVVGLVVRRIATVNWMSRPMSSGLMAVGLIALLLPAVTWSVTPVLAGPSNASLPTSGPEALNQNDPTSWTQLKHSVNGALVSYLEAHQDGYFYLVAVANSQ